MSTVTGPEVQASPLREIQYNLNPLIGKRQVNGFSETLNPKP